MFLLNASGAGVEKYKYDAFGAPTITDWSGNARTTSAYGNPFMFSGRDYLPAFGIYDLRNRMYNPSTGYFHQTDPIGFAGDPYYLYRFAGNNPLLGGDPTGLFTAAVSSSLFGDDTSYGVFDDSSGGYGGPIMGQMTFVFDGAQYAYGTGYGPYDKYMEGIFGPSSEGGMDVPAASFDFAGGFPTFSGTGFFGGLSASPGRRVPSVGAGLTNIIRVPVEFMIGEKWGAAYRGLFNGFDKSPTGPPVPANVAAVLRTAFANSPPDADLNGFHATHAGSNARLTQMFGVAAAPLIFLGGVFHETPLDPSYIKDEVRNQGLVNAQLDSMGDIVANSLGIAIGAFDRTPNGVSTAMKLGNRIPGPTDPWGGRGTRYKGNPAAAWGPYGK